MKRGEINMTDDLGNIEETRRALQDMREMRERWNRILSQLDIYYTRQGKTGEIPNPQRWAMEQQVKITETEEVLQQHLKDMGGR